ncbi:low molecular weight protein-tyrosine-phosphatase [Ureibacillus terrenus]|uniref:protein-tyrosine-phosphatase n=1 Tax=Ureibacillus terrenus TaxID=118246 RepID=A0A540V0T5_9BACL|nr:low molecular weight protein-tyrosine-phosphatase [Ureibacillus terrenus]MED3662220.1 low molecular weight phosphotyrosine protein phosphatase [Ureibacillus terrenus]MED3765124.1 low molecular weight phosphotyrosine protein phosphatase [Ureibacillus terrenus]TQE90380.1 low molecular weight phosphotyrosine protein phosphatase [Ureibacillus terrenus]
MKRVIFVCLGNICRSPMAEAIFKNMLKKRGLEGKIVVDSAGTSSWHVGERPHHGALNKLREYNIPTDGIIARQLKKEDFEKFDYIVGMDQSNIRDIRRILGQPDHPKIFRFLDLTDHKKDVPDPYYTGDFQETYELVVEGCEALLNKILEDMEKENLIL